MRPTANETHLHRVHDTKIVPRQFERPTQSRSSAYIAWRIAMAAAGTLRVGQSRLDFVVRLARIEEHSDRWGVVCGELRHRLVAAHATGSVQQVG
jgi:hypothetical protein